MKEIVNSSGLFLVIRSEDGYYDSNGCFYNELTQSQKMRLDKSYYFEILQAKLLIYKIVVEEDCEKIVISKDLVADYEYKDNRLYRCKATNELMLMVKNGINPELFISYISCILKRKPYYEKISEWLKKTIIKVCDSVEDILYVKIFQLFESNMDGILSELMMKDMYGIFYDFLYFYEPNKTSLKEFHDIIKIAWSLDACFTKRLKLIRNTGNYERGELLRSIYELLNCYEKKNIDLIQKFIKSLIVIDEYSISADDYCYDYIHQIIKNLCSIKKLIPTSDFYKNVNYLLACIYKNYEDSLNLKGFMNVSSMWNDYLVMKMRTDEVYPGSLKTRHDEVLNHLKLNDKELSIKTMHNFKCATESYKNLEYENQLYCIRIPSEAVELKKVGETLKICVGTYINAVAAGRSKILWLCRKGEEPPIVALEVQKSNLIQAKAYRNTRPDENVDEFIRNWCLEKNLIKMCS